jgi:SAM-dependent methyltransferase
MKQLELSIYECPNCRSGELSLDVQQSAESGDTITGIIKCTGCCSEFSVANGLPRFVPAENYAGSFGYQWNIHIKTQLDSYSGSTISRDRVFGLTQWKENHTGERILEAGSGAGRFTEILLETGADVVSFDYSSAVDANQQNNGEKPNLTLFQGDIFNIPLTRESFDYVFCFGVLQHTPDPKKAFESLVDFVCPGGELAIDVYRRDFFALLQWKYLLRPVTKRLDKKWLYKFLETVVPALIPVARILRSVAGRAGARLVPIVEYSHLGLSPKLNRQWAILDTFDMYSPEHDHPQSIATVEDWFRQAGLEQVEVRRGPNGVIGKGKKPERPQG